jgi:hypothetical protein
VEHGGGGQASAAPASSDRASSRGEDLSPGVEQRARALAEEAELDALRAEVDSGRDRIRGMDELARERAAIQEAWTRIVTGAANRARREAEALLEEAERECAALRRTAEAEASRGASEMTAAARSRAQSLLEEAEREAKAIVAATSDERARLLTALERERRELEYARRRLDSIDALELAEQRAKESLAAAEDRLVSLLEDSEAEARRILDEARRTALERLEEAEREARRIVEDAGARVRTAGTAAGERGVLDGARRRLGGLLAETLARVEGSSRRS